MSIDDLVWKASNRLAKWRQVFAGWQLGTRPKTDPECAAVSDHRELSLMLRVEMNALVAMLTKKELLTKEEWQQALLDEIELTQKDLEGRFPGMKATDIGITYTPEAAATMARLNFKP